MSGAGTGSMRADVSVHPTAIVEPGARLGEQVSIGAHAYVGGEVELGPGVALGVHAVVEGRTRVGARTRVFAHACLGAEPQIKGVMSAEPTTLVIGEDNVLREHVTVHRGSLAGRGETRIGDRNYLMSGSHVGHDGRVGHDCVLAPFAALGGFVSVDDHAFLGAYTGVHQHARIGESVMTAAGSKLTNDAPPFAMVAGDRARLIGLNSVGLRRRGFDPAQLRAIKRAYRVLFPTSAARRVGSFEEALASLEDDAAASPYVRCLLDFVRQSERGLCPRHRSAT